MEPSKSHNVLLVEDYFVNQEVTKNMLENFNCHVDVAQDGVEALEYYREHHYDLILMDIQMPNMDGYEATLLIRQEELAKGKKEVPIIAITANALEENLERCLEVGMNEFILKPIEQASLKKIVGKYIHLK